MISSTWRRKILDFIYSIFNFELDDTITTKNGNSGLDFRCQPEETKGFSLSISLFSVKEKSENCPFCGRKNLRGPKGRELFFSLTEWTV
jgi:hypothetical protein